MKTRWFQPDSLAEALRIVASEESALPFAGGTDILPRLNRDLHTETLRTEPRPAFAPGALVGLGRILDLAKIEEKEGSVSIGPLVTHARLALDPLIREKAPALAEGAALIGSPQIRNRGTLGGNIMNASPAADTVPPLIALDTEVVLASTRGERILPLRYLAAGPGATRAERDEILVEVRIPDLSEKPFQFFRRLAARRSQAIAKVSVAFCSGLDKGSLNNVGIALGAVGPKVLAAEGTARLLEGRALTSRLIDKAAESAAAEAAPITDIRSTDRYRRAMTGELLRQGLKRGMEEGRRPSGGKE